MKEKTYKEKDIKKLLSQKPVQDSCNVFQVENGIEKINRDVLFDIQRFHHVMFPIGNVDEEQIKWLHEKQEKIELSQLPNGIIYYQEYPIGVMYPKYFKGYQKFSELYTEETSLLFKNLKQSVINNIELLENGIYNYDFTMSNILYNQEDVQLIDLDGKYISKHQSLQRVYSYYIIGMIGQIVKKIEMQYDEYSRELAYQELRNVLSRIPSIPMKIDYPILLLDEIEQRKILKR